MAKSEVPPKTLQDVVVLSFEGDIVTLSAAVAQPPGTRVVFALLGVDTGLPLEVRGKVVTVAKRIPAGVVLAVKLSLASKQTRDALSAALRPSAP